MRNHLWGRRLILVDYKISNTVKWNSWIMWIYQIFVPFSFILTHGNFDKMNTIRLVIIRSFDMNPIYKLVKHIQWTLRPTFLKSVFSFTFSRRCKSAIMFFVKGTNTPRDFHSPYIENKYFKPIMSSRVWPAKFSIISSQTADEYPVYDAVSCDSDWFELHTICIKAGLFYEWLTIWV